LISYFTPHNHYYENLNGKEVCIDDEIPFEIPDNWTWTRLNALTIKLGSGSTPTGGKSVYVDSGIKFIRSQNVYNDGLKSAGIAYITEEVNRKKSGSIVKPMDILLNITGGSIGRCTLIPDDFDIANINQHVMIVRLVNCSLRHYIHTLLCSNYIFELIMDEQVGATKEGLSAEKAARFILPIPPLGEQRRILAKINSIQPLIDGLSPLDDKIKSINHNMNSELERSILQYAIHGKLVPQDPSEQPVVIDCKNPIIRRDNSYYELIENQELCLGEEIPFVIPESWLWIRFEDLVCFNLGRTPSRAKEHYWSGGTIPWVSIGDMPERGVLTNTKEKITPVGFQDNYSKMCPIGTLIMSFKLSIGKICYTQIESVHNEAIIDITIKEPQECNYDWLYYVLPYVSRNTKSASAIKGNTLNKDSMRKMLIPLPPIQEQQRIISKLKELQALLDTLE